MTLVIIPLLLILVGDTTSFTSTTAQHFDSVPPGFHSHLHLFASLQSKWSENINRTKQYFSIHDFILPLKTNIKAFVKVPLTTLPQSSHNILPLLPELCHKGLWVFCGCHIPVAFRVFSTCHSVPTSLQAISSSSFSAQFKCHFLDSLGKLGVPAIYLNHYVLLFFFFCIGFTSNAIK